MVSIITACKNRNRNLRAVIDSWLHPSNNINDIVIVDWSSDISCMDTLSDILPHDSIRIIRVEGQKRWALSPSFNIAAKFAKGPILLKLDCDYLLDKDFIKNHKLRPGEFYTGDWRRARTDQERYLNGLVMCYRSDFLSIGGYNEYLSYRYGYDDDDLYKRLADIKLIKKPINNDYVSHLEHSSAMRSPNDTYIDIQYNRLVSENCPMSPEKMHEFIHTEVIHIPTMIQYITGRCYLKVSVSDTVLAKVYDSLTQLIKYTRKDNQYNVFYLSVQNGLGNKLRALASGYNMLGWLRKQHYNSFAWKLVVVWPQDHHCEASYDDLFMLHSLTGNDPDVTFVSTYDIEPDVIAFYGTISPDGPNPFDRLREQIGAECSKIYLESANVIDYPERDWFTDTKYLKSLIPSHSVQELITSVENDLGNIRLGDLIGVHVRLGQNTTSDDISGWPDEKRMQWMRWRKASQWDNFAGYIREKYPTALIYLASDTAEVYNAANVDFPNRVFSLRRDKYDRSAGQVITALADAIILSRTRLLLGSNWSSFTELVIRLGVRKNLLAGRDF